MRTLVHLHTCTCPPAPLLLLPFPHHCFGYTIWLYNLGSICCSLCRYYSLLSPVQSSFLIYVLVFLCNYCHCVIIAFFSQNNPTAISNTCNFFCSILILFTQFSFSLWHLSNSLYLCWFESFLFFITLVGFQKKGNTNVCGHFAMFECRFFLHFHL